MFLNYPLLTHKDDLKDLVFLYLELGFLLPWFMTRILKMSKPVFPQGYLSSRGIGIDGSSTCV